MAAQAQPKMKLYWLERSRAQSVLWLLEELKLDYELELFKRNKDTRLAPPELKKAHALGKSPVLEITGTDGKPIVLAETGFIAQYLSEHYAQGTTMMPKRYRDGQEGQPGGETEEWLRWQYFLHYAEGSLMPVLVMAIVISTLRSDKVPFLIRPLTSMVAGQIFSAFIFPNAKNHFEFLEERLATSGGDYLCGKDLNSADIVVSFGLMAGKEQFKSFGKWDKPLPELYPKVWAYINRMEAQPGYAKSLQKIKDIDDSFKAKW